MENSCREKVSEVAGAKASDDSATRDMWRCLISDSLLQPDLEGGGIRIRPPLLVNNIGAATRHSIFQLRFCLHASPVIISLLPP